MIYICINYVDDIVIFSKTFEKHIQSLVEKVLDRLKENKLQINLSKVVKDLSHYLDIQQQRMEFWLMTRKSRP